MSSSEGIGKPLTPSRAVESYLARVSLALWWGGLTVYAAIVVPTGSRVTDTTTQGFVTQQVTLWLLGLLVVALIANARSVFASRQRFRVTAWAVLALLVPAAAGIHWSLDQMLDPDAQSVVVDGDVFYRRHQIYLWLTVGHWLGGLILLWPSPCGDAHPETVRQQSESESR